MAHLFEAASLTNFYAKFRPQPPPLIMNRLIKYVFENLTNPKDKAKLAIDVGCGSGQVFVKLLKMRQILFCRRIFVCSVLFCWLNTFI